MTTTTSPPFRILAVGANPTGRGGEWIQRIRSLPQRWKLCGVVDPSPIFRQFWEREKYLSFATLEEALSSAQPQAVVIAVPPAFSASLQSECARRQIAVLAEKPLAASLPELALLEKMYQENPVPLVVGVQRRSHPTYQFLKSILAQRSAIPRELFIHIALGRPPGDVPDGHRADPAMAGGGVLLDLGYHALDLAHFFLEHPLEPISCTLSGDGDLAPILEHSAWLLGRSGNTWVRIVIERFGTKSECVQIKLPDGVWTADRTSVNAPDGECAFTAAKNWDQAETQRLELLAQHLIQQIPSSSDLWDHLAILQVIEHSYAIARTLGLETKFPSPIQPISLSNSASTE